MSIATRAVSALAAVALLVPFTHPTYAAHSALSSRALWANDANSIVKVSTYPSDLAAIFDTEIIEGTGFFVQNGYIVTCYHVIQHAHVYIDVTLRNLPGTAYQGQVYHAHVVATDPAQDLALLQLNNGWDGSVLPLGNPQWLRVGDPVAVFGHPEGQPLQVQPGTYEGRDTRELVGGYGALHNMLALYDTTAPGDSGSPVFGPGGGVVGVLESGGGNWSYAVPITDLQTLAQTAGPLGRTR